MFEILRNISRHKFRTGLTILGIVIGIFAVTVMGSMTEYFNVLIDNGLKMAGKSITVTAKGGLHAILTDSDRRAVERVPGVKAVFPMASGRLDPAVSGVQMGISPTVVAFPPEYFEYEDLALKRGRWIQRGDSYAAVIGSKIAQSKKLDLGG